MKRPKLNDKSYKAFIREIDKLEGRFGVLETRGAMRHYLNNMKEKQKRIVTIRRLRHELDELESKP